MAAAVVTFTRPSDVRGHKEGNKQIRYFDVAADTGDYAAEGFTKTAASLGFRHIAFVHIGSIASQGTLGVSAVGVGVTYVSSGTSVKFQLYEAAAANAPLAEKGAEAYVAGVTFRIRVEGE